jgi:flavin-dependent dehydrogenase
VSHGVNFRRERVLGFSRSDSHWLVRTDQSNHEVDFLVGADGVNSFVRKILGSRFPSEDLMLTFGYRLPVEMDDRIIIEFYPNFHGYLWAFPRPQHVSIGICGRLQRYGMKELKQYLHKFMKDFLTSRSFESTDKIIYSSLIPSLRPESLLQNTFSGDGWALVGDAAGFCDPITCEGIYYALRSGELLAEAISERGLETYPQTCKDDFMADFIHGANLFDRFYAGKFLGSDFITRMVQIIRRSPALRSVMNSFVSGKQNYKTLRSTLLRRSPRILMELLIES